MSVNTLRRGIWTILIAVLAGSACAQGIGVQVADPGRPIDASRVFGTVSVNSSENLDYHGVRASYDLYDSCRLFMDLGLADAEETFLTAQVGALIPVYVDSPVDVSLRIAGFRTLDNDYEWTGLNVLCVGSRELDFLPAIVAYGAFGFNYMTYHNNDESDTDTMMAAGLMANLAERFGLFFELTLVDEFFIGGGARMAF